MCHNITGLNPHRPDAKRGVSMPAVHRFNSEPAFKHDFARVDYDLTEFGERAGTPGLYTVRGKVKAGPRASLLPPDLFSRLATTHCG